ncbi:MAG: MerR family DNA-binding transcriptional regulator, partial [Candidatus Omnitrophica bacterium]|nr:MerR family DNA-binding transcriptional regulator [Candidatus Omnitrophota bacterium]
MSKNHSFQIGAVAEKTGLSVHTIRYYEKLGL